MGRGSREKRRRGRKMSKVGEEGEDDGEGGGELPPVVQHGLCTTCTLWFPATLMGGAIYFVLQRGE